MNPKLDKWRTTRNSLRGVFDHELGSAVVEFLVEYLPEHIGQRIEMEDSRRRLGGRPKRVLSDLGYTLEFSRPYRDEQWRLWYNVRVMLRDKLWNYELLTTQQVSQDLAAGLRNVAKQVGMRVLNPRRGRKVDNTTAGLFDHELGLTGRV